MKQVFQFLVLLLMASNLRAESYATRARDAAANYAEVQISNENFPKDAMPLYTARLMNGANRNETLAAVDRMMDAALKSKTDPFHLHAIVHAERVGGKKWSEPLRGKFRAYAARWNYTKAIGVSLNYELMRDGAGWMAAGIWPDLVDQAGNDSGKIRQLCGARLRKTLSNIQKQGSTEYDAPLYYGTDFMALRLLTDFADEKDLRESAGTTLNWMLAQTGAHWHRGYSITTAGRAKYYGSQIVSPDSPGATTGMAWLVFGGERRPNLAAVPQIYWLAYEGPFTRSLDKLRDWQAALPVPRSVRAKVEIPAQGFSVRKLAWITEGYGLASQRADLSPLSSYLFKESRGNMLRWVSDKPASSFFVFQENRRRPKEKIPNAFAYGENPYAQTLQHEGTLLGVYAVPEDYGFHRMHAAFTTRGAIVARLERDGWICAHGGTVLFGFRSIAPAARGKSDSREKFDNYVCDEPRNGWVLETSPIEPYAGEGGADGELKRFADALIQKTKCTADLASPQPKLTFINLAGRRLELDWHPPGQPYLDQCRIDGDVIDYPSYPMLAVDGKIIFK